MYIRIDMTKTHQKVAAGMFAFHESKVHATRLLDYHVILYLEYGQWDIKYLDKTLHIKAGDVAFLPANVEHFGVSKCQRGTMGIFLHYSASEQDGVTESIERGGKFLYVPRVVSVSDQKQIKNVFSRIVEYSTSDIPYKYRICDSLFDGLIILLNDQNLEPQRNLLCSVTDLFRFYSEEFLSNNQIAKEIKMSTKALERLFRKETGKSLHQYQTDFKISAAREMIQSYPEMTLTEIGLSLGFYDSAHFSRVFKKSQGISPRQFRKRVLYHNITRI